MDGMDDNSDKMNDNSDEMDDNSDEMDDNPGGIDEIFCANRDARYYLRYFWPFICHGVWQNSVRRLTSPIFVATTHYVMSFFQNKVVVITGGSDGIGKALIAALIPLGAKVATCGRNHDKIYKLQLEYSNVMLHAIACDVSNEQECRNFIESTIETFGGIDILINNAGISMRGLFLETATDVTRKVMDINFLGAVYCTRYALPSILYNRGTVVGVSSIAGYRGLPGRSAYSAS